MSAWRTRRLRLGTLAGLPLLAVWLAGCATRAPPPITAEPAPRPPASAAVQPPLHGFEQQQLERAEGAEVRGHWAEAALAWEVLSLLRPDDARLRDRLAGAQSTLAQRAAEQQALALAAQRRGDADAAAQAWLALLALAPSDRPAADALRQLERERNRRSQVGRFARPPLAARRAGGIASPAPMPSATAADADAARTANSQREHATLLARQGDLDGAIALLRDGAPWRSLPGHRTLLADLYVRKAESLRSTQPEAARVAVDEALAIDARHAAALALRAQLPRPAGRAAPPTPRSISP